MILYNSPFGDISNRKHNVWCNYTTRIDTYGCGCEHNCKYCYSRHLLEFRKKWDSKRPKPSNFEKIKKEISKLKTNQVVKLGGLTDCFQNIEKKYRLTYDTIKELNKKRINYLIVTKSDLVADDKYLQIYDKELAHFQISITSTSDEISKKYENCPSVTKRIRALKILESSGFDTTLRVSPFLYEYIDIDKLNCIKSNKILIEFLKVNSFIKKTFDIDYSKYNVKYGGQLHLELDTKINIIKQIKHFKEISVGESVYSHWEYFRDNLNFNKKCCCNLSIKNKEYFDVNIVDGCEQMSLF